MSRKAILLLIIFFCSLAAAAAPRPVVMISIDGLRPDYITHADEHGLAIPHLRRFLAEGTYAEGVTGVLPTVTYPSHTTLVTGVEPARHGIVNNTVFDPMLKNMGGWYWYAQDIRVPTLWDAAAGAGLVTASVGWPVTVGEKNIRYDLPEYWRAGIDEDRKLLRAVSTPGLVEEMEASFGPYPNGEQTDVASDEVRTKVTLRLLSKYHAQFLTLHLSALDHIQHGTGPFSKEACAVLEQLDGQIGRLVEGALANDPQTVVLVVSDHGFVRTDHRVNLLVPFVAQGLIQIQRPVSAFSDHPRIVGWEASPWSAGGSAAIVLAHPDDEKIYAKTKALLTQLAADSRNGIARVVEKEEAAKMGGFPGAAFVVEFAAGYQMGYGFDGPVLTPAPSTGMHGYFPDRPDLRASFFAMGKGIAAHRDLGVVDMRRIAPTVAAILGVKLPSAKMDALAVGSE